MRFTRRDVTKFGLGLAAMKAGLGPLSQAAAQETSSPLGTGVRATSNSLIGEPKYKPGFQHVDYVNPKAPKGGAVRDFANFRFDTLNPYNVGLSSASTAAYFVVETLMGSSSDEGGSQYCLLSEWMEASKDHDWVAFRLRDEARFHDGKQITVEDAITSLELLTKKGHPFYGGYYKNVVKARDLGDRVVLFEFDQKGNRELPHIMGQLWVFPAHWWSGRAFDESLLEPMLGSGPYRITRFETNRFVDLERVPDYWGADLPFNTGRYNFDSIRLEYIADEAVAFNEFKKGALTYWIEGTAKDWATAYDFPAVQSGEIVRLEAPREGPQGLGLFFLNTRREQFQDRRAREALNLLLDFENLNTAVYYNQYSRPYSYFQGTPDLMATDKPDAAELALLEPFRDQLPPKVFTEVFKQPVTRGQRISRRRRRQASRLLDAAGWTLQDGVRRNAKGEPFKMEIIHSSKAFVPTFVPYVQNLQREGIEASYRILEPAQFVKRRKDFDYDCLAGGFGNSESPGNEQRDLWGSELAEVEASRNYAGVKNPVVDALIEKVIFAKSREELATACRALDRVLLFEHYGVLRAFVPVTRVAYWRDAMARPETLPARSLTAGLPRVWWSPKAEG